MLQQAVSRSLAWYQLTFTPPSGDRIHYHRLEVRVDKPKTEVRTQHVYYTTP